MNNLPIQCNFREVIKNIDNILVELPQLVCPLSHTFLDGVYTREFKIKAPALATGRVHTFACTNILAAGQMVVWSEYQGIQVLKAPYIWTSPAGTKRMFYVLEDVTWYTVHKTSNTNTEELEEELFSYSYEEYESKVNIIKEG